MNQQTTINRAPYLCRAARILPLLALSLLAACERMPPRQTAEQTDPGITLAKGDAKIISATPELSSMVIDFDGKQIPAWYDESLELYFRGQRVPQNDFPKALTAGREMTIHAIATNNNAELYLRRVWVK
jgi:hypothetical protein